MRRFFSAVAVVALVGACSSGDSEPAAVESTTTVEAVAIDSNAAPFHAVPDEAQVVWGTARCSEREGVGSLVLDCELDMSDPRVSGTETIDQLRHLAIGSGGAVWTMADVITNAEGTWRGSDLGADDTGALPVGEGHMVGEGTYEGLEFHYYLVDLGFEEGGLDDAYLRGWISESTAADPASTEPVFPFHAISGGSVPVSGTAACDDTDSGTVCQLDLTDPRVSGTETQDGVRVLAGSVGAGDVRMADDPRIEAAEGTWRGRIQAASDDAAVPTSIGEAHYIGEGAYEGFEFHYYFADLESAEGRPVRVHGWISLTP